MNRLFITLLTSLVLASTFTAPPALADEQDAIDGCIDELREVGGPDARNGVDVVRSEFSQAATEVILRDAGETTWRCIAWSSGEVVELQVQDAMDDGEGAMGGAYDQYDGGESDGGFTATETIRFDAGRSSGEFNDGLTPGSSTRWTLRARDGQMLNVVVSAESPDIWYQIFNPDGSFLLEQMSPDKEYKGQLWQSGEHVIEVINRGRRNASYNLWVGID
jgi:hypothetical protein